MPPWESSNICLLSGGTLTDFILSSDRSVRHTTSTTLSLVSCRWSAFGFRGHVAPKSLCLLVCGRYQMLADSTGRRTYRPLRLFTGGVVDFRPVEPCGRKSCRKQMVYESSKMPRRPTMEAWPVTEWRNPGETHKGRPSRTAPAPTGGGMRGFLTTPACEF
jgi:hypothetical protein